MRIFIQNDHVSPDRLVRRALYVLFKAGVYSAEGGGSIRGPAAVLIDAAGSYRGSEQGWDSRRY